MELEQLREELDLLSTNAKAERAALDIVFGEVFAVMAPTKDGRTRNDWRDPEDRAIAISDHIMAARRHINKGERGEVDSETGKLHLLHAIARLAMAATLQMEE